jgi:hypothetical protein
MSTTIAVAIASTERIRTGEGTGERTGERAAGSAGLLSGTAVAIWTQRVYAR